MENVFALDIGTRVVIGVIMQKAGTMYRIIASSRAEHTQRAMYDGQVHDVEEVARIVRMIKRDLEQKTNITLRKVAVAAAGRALCTEVASAVREEILPVEWEKNEVLALEMEAVQKAMSKISSNEIDHGFFHCVGYNTVKTFLEDHPIGSLIGQKGKKAELTVIATFLPRTVVDGLIAVLKRSELEMDSLTLEPIAVGQAAIPADMRRLNLALVDIGAGTADIALTKDGTFFSYGMVPMAGDEVTEAICSHYLLDFQEGERIKKDLSHHDEVAIKNFFGEVEYVPKEDVLNVIRPVVRIMAERISQEILLLNAKSPQAVILVGGGSLTPLLADMLAEIMQIPRSRVGVQVRERLNRFEGEEDRLVGSDVITPIGIGMSALDGQGLHYYTVYVNNIGIPLFELQLATVAEALLAAGIQPRSFLGRPGAAIVYEVNGAIRVLKGGLGNPAIIYVNGREAVLDQRLTPEDHLEFLPGEWGADASAQLKDVITLPPAKKVFYNEEPLTFKAQIDVDGKPAEGTDWLKDGYKITIHNNDTLKDLLRAQGVAETRSIRFTINNEPRVFEQKTKVLVNGVSVGTDYIIKDNDRITAKTEGLRLQDLELTPEPMILVVNGQEFLLPPPEKKVLSKGQQLKPQDIITDGMALSVEGFRRRPILSELLPHLNLTETVSPGSRLEMLVNGLKAEFTTELKQGDRIIIEWKPN